MAFSSGERSPASIEGSLMPARLRAKELIMPDYIPGTDQGKRDFGLNMKTVVATGPTDFGLTLAQSTALGAAVDQFVADLAIATAPSTRTPSAPSFKRTCRGPRWWI
jgi:hypothetical protein